MCYYYLLLGIYLIIFEIKIPYLGWDSNPGSLGYKLAFELQGHQAPQKSLYII